MHRRWTLLSLFVVVAVLLLSAGPARANSIEQEGLVMGCFIDTPAYDTYRENDCYLLGSEPSTAAFKVLNITEPSRYVIDWSVSTCTNPSFCTIPIRPNQNKTVSATVTDLYTGDQAVLSATAHYIFDPGF